MWDEKPLFCCCFSMSTSTASWSVHFSELFGAPFILYALCERPLVCRHTSWCNDQNMKSLNANTRLCFDFKKTHNWFSISVAELDLIFDLCCVCMHYLLHAVYTAWILCKPNKKQWVWGCLHRKQLLRK